VNKKGEEPRSLLRRLLKQADEQNSQESNSSANPRKQPGSRTTGEASPVRPTAPEAVEPPPQMPPQPRATQETPGVVHPTGVEERLQAEEALEKLRQRTAETANEFAEGKINRAQFTAMYAYFNEKRVIIERLLARDPDTHAWQPVAKGGQTTFLRQHFEARVLSYTIFDNASLDPETPITSQGSVVPSVSILKPVLTALAVMMKTRVSDKPIRALQKQIDNGRWIAIIPGVMTSAIVLFSLEPSSQQFTMVTDIHQDFERANRITLSRGIRVPEQLVFPHRALFEKPGHDASEQ
jgi:hypothetical protein